MRAVKAAPLALFAVLLLHGATIGMTDDEAYYWVLAQHPALGYAFHPPAMAWAIAAAQALFGGGARPWVVRLPAAAGTALILWLALRWLASVGKGGLRGVAVLLSFAGLFALGWMMVPDIPLFVGWTLAFVATWNLCFNPRPRDYAMLAFGAALAMLSKYSAILAAPSVAACLLAWGGNRRWKGIAAAAIGALLAAVPIVLWNAEHGWASILYQIHDRHGQLDPSFKRYLRFWLIEGAAAGPVTIAFFFWILRSWRESKVYAYCAAWAFPGALVFCVQPLFFGDFKPHWAFIAWWPAALALAYADRFRRAIRMQIAYGLTLGVVALVACHVPLLRPSDPKLDPTNDLYGWNELPSWLEARHAPRLPIVGARYQTAAQAAFAIGDLSRVTLIPRDLKARDEWPELGVTDGFGPDWPRLTKPVLFVADNRYDAGPDFREARCSKLGRLEAERGGVLAKSIDVWECAPAAARP